MRHALAPALVLLLATLTPNVPARADSPFAPYASPQQRVQVAPGRSIHVICMGQGSPTVILSAGADGWAADWRLVQPQIAAKTRVCAWDRAGHGFSSGSPDPQDTAHTEADLEQALAGAGVTGPLVMVAHSLGAFETLIFADRQPDRVAGMVMVDPSNPDQEAQLARAAPALMAWSDESNQPFFNTIVQCIAALRQGGKSPAPDCAKLQSRYPQPLRGALIAAASDPSYWEAFRSLFQSRMVSSRQAINPRRSYGPTPLIVLDAGVFAFPTAPADARREVPAARAVIKAGHEAMAALSTRGVVIPVPDSAHAIALQKPKVVIDAVGGMIDEVRARPTR